VCPLCQFNIDGYHFQVRAQYGDVLVPAVYFTQLMGLAFGLPENELGWNRAAIQFRWRPAQPQPSNQPVAARKTRESFAPRNDMKTNGNCEVRIGFYICHCGHNIAAMVDCAEVARYAGQLPGVTLSRDYKYMCSDPGQEMIQKDIREFNLNRIVVASCSPLLHEHTFRTATEAGGLNPFFFHMVNVREHDS